MTFLNKLKSTWRDLARDRGPVPPVVNLSTDEWELGMRLGIDMDVLVQVKSVTSPLSSIHTVERVVGDFSQIFAVDVAPTFARDALRELRLALQPLDWHAFYYDRKASHISIVVMQTRDPFDVLRLRGTHGGNHTTEQLIQQLASWDREFGVVVVGAGDHWVDIELVDQPADCRRFIADLAAFSPTARAALGSSDEDAIAALTEHGRIYLRW